VTGERSGRPLRVGVLVDSLRVPAWVERVLADVAAMPGAELALVVVNAAPARREGFDERLPYLLYRIYSRVDRKLLPPPTDPFARRDVANLLAGVPSLSVRPEQTRYSDRFPEDALAEIRRHDLDVALRFGFRILRGGALGIARHGVWSYHHDDDRRIRGGPPGFWEVMEGHPVTGSLLQVLSERLDGGRVIYRSWAPTHRRSVVRNRAHVYWKSAAFAGRCLRALAATGDPAAGEARPPSEDRYRPYAYRLYRKPTNREALPLLARFGRRAVGEWSADRPGRRQWLLAYRFHEPGGDQAADELFRFRRLVPPPGRSWADPFAVRREGRWHLFFEEHREADGRGRIRTCVLDPEAGPSEPADAVVEPFHLSYPHLISWRGELLMVPETGARCEVRLYRATDFPTGWTHEATLLEGVRAVDATLHEEDGRWWMFVSIAEPGALHARDELHLFHAASPLGPWEPHPWNPVRSDARSARPAGPLFRWRGELYRPAQDCSRRYGWAVVLQRVTRLDRQGYAEETVGRVAPEWAPDLLATHTLCRLDGLTLVDAMRRSPGW